MQHDTITADDGERLHVRLSGNGPPILLLHGWTSSHASWAPLIEPLGQRHRLLRPDARGHGGHALGMTREPDVKRLARDVMHRRGVEARAGEAALGGIEQARAPLSLLLVGESRHDLTDNE